MSPPHKSPIRSEVPIGGNSHDHRRIHLGRDHLVCSEGTHSQSTLQGGLHYGQGPIQDPAVSNGITICFCEKDEERVHTHDDAMVVMMQIVNFTTRRILVDNGSSTNIILWEAFVKMGISPDRLHLAHIPLKCFIGDTV